MPRGGGAGAVDADGVAGLVEDFAQGDIDGTGDLGETVVEVAGRRAKLAWEHRDRWEPRPRKVVGAPEASVWLVASAGRKNDCTAGNFAASMARIFTTYSCAGRMARHRAGQRISPSEGLMVPVVSNPMPLVDGIGRADVLDDEHVEVRAQG